MMKLIGELAAAYRPCGFYIDKGPNGRYRLWVSGLYMGEFGSLDEIRAWCKDHLKEG